MTRLSSHLVSCQPRLEASENKLCRRTQMKSHVSASMKAKLQSSIARELLSFSLGFKYCMDWESVAGKTLHGVILCGDICYKEVFAEGEFSFVLFFPAWLEDFVVWKIGCDLESGVKVWKGTPWPSAETGSSGFTSPRKEVIRLPEWGDSQVYCVDSHFLIHTHTQTMVCVYQRCKGSFQKVCRN